MSGALPHDDLGAAWRAARAPLDVVHLDAAGCSCPSRATLDAVIGHLRREAAIGGYPAAAEAAPVVERARAGLAALLGVGTDEIALVENASRAFAAVLHAWPLPRRARVGVLPNEYASNRLLLEAMAQRGRVDLVELDGADASLDGLDALSLVHVASHRGVVQPAGQVVARARASGIPVMLDVAQSAGQLDLAGIEADAYVGVSRKWLRGPRGVGFVAVRRPWADRLDPAWPDHWSRDATGAARLAIAESSIAARVGLAVAVDELLAVGVSRVAERVAALGRRARTLLDGVAGWQVQEPVDAASGIVTLAHDSLDPLDTQAELFAAGITTSAIEAGRALELTRPVLRASFHAYCDDDDVEALARALRAIS